MQLVFYGRSNANIGKKSCWYYHTVKGVTMVSYNVYGKNGDKWMVNIPSWEWDETIEALTKAKQLLQHNANETE